MSVSERHTPGVRLILAALCATPALLAAQQPDRAGPPQEDSLQVSYIHHRARMGVTINLRASATDSIGAYVEAVTPGGPAARAGIRSGDIITRVNLQDLRVGGGPSPDMRFSAPPSLPGVRLIELAARLDPNDTLTLEYRRDGKRRVTQLVTDVQPGWVAYETPRGVYFSPPESMGFRIMPLPPQRALLSGARQAGDQRELPHEPPPIGGSFIFAWNSPLADLELAPLNPMLGRYFGAGQGVLVLDVPDSSELNLQPGDVIRSVDGRPIASPAHLLRVLRSYEGSERFRLGIVRMHRAMVVQGSLGAPRR